MSRSLQRAARSNRAAVLVACVCVSFGCKKNDGQTAPGGYMQGQVGVGAAAGAGPTAPMAQGGAPAVAQPGATGVAAAAGAPGVASAPTATSVPAHPTVPPPPAGPTAQRLDATAAAAVTPILASLTKDNVQAGAKPIGEAVVGNFAQGQTLEFPIQLQPNKCYTIVAAGLPPVGEVNVQLELATVVPGMAPVLAVDQDRGALAVLGKKSGCYRWMFGVIAAPGKVVLQVPAGSGLVAAQAYEK